MNKYEIIVYWSEEDNAFISEVPELAGCMADGNTRSESIENAEIAINEWIETAKIIGREVPQPKYNNFAHLMTNGEYYINFGEIIKTHLMTPKISANCNISPKISSRKLVNA